MPQHRLRYWEGRFPQLKPLTRAGDRRYYRPVDIALLRRIHGLLQEGYTVRGVQGLLAREEAAPAVEASPVAANPAPVPATPPIVEGLRRVRALLAEALAADDVPPPG